MNKELQQLEKRQQPRTVINVLQIINTLIKRTQIIISYVHFAYKLPVATTPCIMRQDKSPSRKIFRGA